MTQIPPEQHCVLDDFDQAARDTSHGGGLCETYHAQMVDVTEDPTPPADDTTTAQSTNEGRGDYTPDEDSAYSPDEIDLDGVEPDTYPEDLVEGGACGGSSGRTAPAERYPGPPMGALRARWRLRVRRREVPRRLARGHRRRGHDGQGWFTWKLRNVADFEVDRVRDEGDRIWSYDGIDLTPDGHSRHAS